MLERLDSIDWASLADAYGSANDVPIRLRALISDDERVRAAALNELFGSVWHQGTGMIRQYYIAFCLLLWTGTLRGLPSLTYFVRLNMNKLLALTILLLAAGASWGKEVFTGEDLNRPFTVHGRLSVYNGSANLRIWIVGSKRMLYVAAESPALEKINRVLGGGDGWFTRDIFGDFSVEPLAPDIKGHMRPVRVTGVKNVVIAREGKVVSRMKAL